MIDCSIQGCKECISELSLNDRELARWIIFRACRCGASDPRNQKACTCVTSGPVQIQYWPMLDWYAFGGVEEIVLCPRHRQWVLAEMIQQRKLDSSMDSGSTPNYGNRH